MNRGWWRHIIMVVVAAVVSVVVGFGPLDTSALITTAVPDNAAAPVLTDDNGVGAAVDAFIATAPDRHKCKLSEFQCTNHHCIPLNHFCNSINDCGDGSDEPRHCTRCNRTYLGQVGITYDLELHRPREDKVPFICQLTFTAAGGDFGDLIQLTFDSFTLGRFTSFTMDGCPDGALQINEAGRPAIGGSWCGTSWGPSIYYSETKTVTLHMNVLKLSRDQGGYNFDFRLEYKFLKKGNAIVRYGGGNTTAANKSSPRDNPALVTQPSIEPEYFLGDLIAGTYCSRIFSDCDKKLCRLQSPNYPGIYPRNLTCYYAVRQHEIPQGKHALITVRQPKGQLVSIRSQSTLYGTASTRGLKVWSDCNDVQDYVTIYDGYTTRDPIVLKFCGGGESVPPTTSSGHEILVEFTTSSYGTFLHPPPNQALHGFQLEVVVQFVDQPAPTYVRNKKQCEFWLRGTNKGVLDSPIHSLPANTTCLYHLQGVDTSLPVTPPLAFRPVSNSQYPDWKLTAGGVIPQFRVWLSVVKFYVDGTIKNIQKQSQQDNEICKSYLNVWDGQVWTATNCKDLTCRPNSDKMKPVPKGNTLISSSATNWRKNVTLMARYCREHIPRTCDHTMLGNETRFPRPCTFAESYITSGDSLTLEFKTNEATALRPVRFTALYEFVNLQMDGEPFGSGPCSRRFTILPKEEMQTFRSPRDTFLFGRGGAENISCVYRFEGKSDERVKLTINQITIRYRDCNTGISPDTERLECVGNTTASVRIFDVPWNDVPGVPKDCLCAVDKDKFLPFTYISTSNVVELHFDAIGMRAYDDISTLSFEGNWKFIRTPMCTKNLRMQAPSGELVFTYGNDETNCENSPRVLIPSSSHKYLYVKMSGWVIRFTDRYGNGSYRGQSSNCATANRIKIHTSLSTVLVCPYESTSRYTLVEVFSEGWATGRPDGHSIGQMSLDRITIDHLGNDLSRTISVEFLGRETGTYYVQWVELTRRRDIPPNGGGMFLIKPDECHFRCPELDGCISSSAWCDGIENCPSGVDEALINCSVILQLPPIYLFVGSLVFLVALLICLVVVWKTIRKRPPSILEKRLKSLSASDTAFAEEKGGIC